MTTHPNGTIVYIPFPDYEVEDPPTGSNTVRTTYRVAGQIVAVQTKVGTATGIYYFTYTDHLGNVAALSWTGGTHVSGSTARYDPFGTFTTAPGSNPSISNHGFTGHRHNNTNMNDYWADLHESTVLSAGKKMPYCDKIHKRIFPVVSA